MSSLSPSTLALAIFSIATPVTAQIVPDATLLENSTVTLEGETFRIQGGTAAGNNLFHSFEEFSIPENATALFENDAGIETIFSRITGNNISRIEGILETQGASLFFLNPNGIIFGRNAQLKIGGSFVATTADSIQFADGSEFDARQPSPLLSVSAPLGLQFGETPGSITNTSQASVEGLNSINLPTGLTVNSNNSLIFAGGDLLFEGGNATNFGGRIELGSVAGSGTVSLNAVSNGYRLGYDGIDQFGTIRLSENSVVDASGLHASDSNPEMGSGDIQIRSGQLFISDSGITSSTFDADGGTFVISAATIDLTGDVQPGSENGSESGELPLLESAGLFSQTQGSGNAGNLFIDTIDLSIRNGAQISTGTAASGNGGDLRISADTVLVDGIGISIDGTRRSSILSQVQPLETIEFQATGNAGNIVIETRELLVCDGGIVGAMTMGYGDGGNISIAADLVEVRGIEQNFQETRLDVGAVPSRQVEPANLGAPGDLTIEARELRVSDRASIVASTRGAQPGGDINVNVDRLALDSGGQIQAIAFGTGDGGNVTVTAHESIDLVGTSPDYNSPTSIVVQSQGRIQPDMAGNGGNLNISTGRLTVRDGAAISADTFAAGNGGRVTVTASESVQVSGRSNDPVSLPSNAPFNPIIDEDGLLPSRITARAVRERRFPEEIDPGEAGNVTINTPFLTIANLAQISVNADVGSPLAGNVTLNTEDLRIENGGALTAEAAFGQGGNLFVNADDVRLLENAQISTTSGQPDRAGTGGNITINTNTLVGLENSNISANAFNGRGGAIDITADDLVLGFEPLSRDELVAEIGEENLLNFDPTADDRNLITALSLTDPALNGTVEIVAPDVDPTQGLVELEDRFAAAPLDRNPCQIGGGDSEFVQTGRGGLPPTPNDPLTGSQPWEDIRAIPLDENTDDATDEPVTQEPVERLIEAQSWIINENGDLQLLPAPQNANDRFQQPGSCEPNTQKSNLDNSNLDHLEPGTVPDTVTISDLTLQGSTVLEPEEIDRILDKYRNRPLSFAEVQQAADELSQHYRERGYITSGVYVPPQTSRDGTLVLQASESKFEDIDVSVRGRLNPSYVRSRLGVETGDLVNQTQLLQTLQLLQLDDRIVTVAAELSAGVRPETNRLSLNVEAASPITADIRLDNNRSPSVGTFRQQARLQFNSLLGFGDTARVSYAHTDGSDEWGVSYTVPFNRSGGTLRFGYDTGANEVVESPFRSLDIEADSRQYELTVRQPLLRVVEVPGVGSQRNRFEEFAIGFTASRRESQTSILGFDFPLSPGAEDDGETKISVLRFFQDWTRQGNDYVFAVRSEFNLGVNWFDATTNDNEPDSQFFAWRGQTQWVRRLENVGNSLLVVRGDVQLTPDALVPFEQISLGGRSTARGYRQDALLADNGILGSVELRVPVLQIPQWNGQLDIVPFVDAGVVWNSDDRNDPERNALVSAGLGLRFRLGDRLRLAVDWGIPFMDLEDRGDSWQEEGLYFSIESLLF